MLQTGHVAMEVSWSRLPEEVGELILAFLPLPDLFRCRSVCRRWNQLVHKASFLELCDRNARNSRGYLFITHHLDDDGISWLDGTYRMMTCFLDLDERRWYSIAVDDSVLTPTHGNIARLLSMNDGLICELSQRPGNPQQFTLVVFDPVANTRWELPADARIRQEDAKPPVVVAAVNDSGFKVFLLDQNSIFMERHSGFFVYESCTNAWRALANPPLELGLRAGETRGRRMEESAVFFQGNLYVTLWYYNSKQRILILSYNLEEDLWREVYAVEAKNPGNPELIVSGNRLFLAAWVDAPRPEGQDFPECILNYSELEIAELFVDRNSSWSRSVAKLTNEVVEEICGESRLDFSSGIPLDKSIISFGFPFNKNDIDDDEFLVLFSRSSGKAMFYNVWSRDVDALPAHPLRPLQRALLMREEARRESEDEVISSYFSAKLMNLSVRNILSGGPVPSRSYA
jgi:hypothetical protein